MRLLSILTLFFLLNGCSLFGKFVWSHPEKTTAKQIADKAECLALSSIVYGSPEDLLNLAENGASKPNKGIEADCLAQKGFKRSFSRYD